jgi:hypothetical protein
MSETRERVHIEDGPKRVRTYLEKRSVPSVKATGCSSMRSSTRMTKRI